MSPPNELIPTIINGRDEMEVTTVVGGREETVHYPAIKSAFHYAFATAKNVEAWEAVGAAQATGARSRTSENGGTVDAGIRKERLGIFGVDGASWPIASGYVGSCPRSRQSPNNRKCIRGRPRCSKLKN